MEGQAIDADLMRISAFSAIRPVGNCPRVEIHQSCADRGQQVWVTGFLQGREGSLLRK